ncbi:metal ABC transporter solute-binding protein, Zn/Mn family [Lyngbya confervoides]|uniref:Zinc ABC transporter substrate-binding protein n=1 Tax=Lyngbya confervoides BDU141951 TaxID=1574623 RepID=A0ABD4SZT3_9CYAN|nr:zinc ABC transporter substrate-binding protein [Lyngbya confervoides]MCM1981931.1 zinc ABC transporter substrate-binding protein [Lyngbya confervoides BDU141951]
MDRLKTSWMLGILLCLLGSGAIAGCRAPAKLPQSPTTAEVMVSIPPQAYWVNRIGGAAVKVETMVPAGTEPHTYEPSPAQLRVMSRADAYFQIHIGFEEAWMDRFRAINPRMKVVDTTSGIQRLPLPTPIYSAEPSPLAPQGQAAKDNVDPHIWLSPQLAKKQVQVIYDTLSQLRPPESAQFQQNFQVLGQDIDRLDQTIRTRLKNLKNRRVLVVHPAWGYFARDYQLQMFAVEVGGEEPSAAELANLVRFAKQHHIKVVFASPQFSQRASKTIAQEIGGKVLLIDPLAYDWIDNLQQVAETFSEEL